MAEESIRKLAAIMFADMVGYTALMQEDEDTAHVRRDRFRVVLTSHVEQHDGEILQYYGDGALSIFGSAVQAVQCAIDVQLELRREPEIPVRIGLHTGDIVHEADGAYGDGVNVASRIEALSAAGGVMISGKVFDEIKNHAAIATVSLGAVSLKNVRHPMRVFAISNEGLAVPTEDEVRAKSVRGTDEVEGGGEGTAADRPGKVDAPGVGEAFLQHVKDAALVQWAVVYVVAAWMSLSVVQFVSGQYEWPSLIPQGFRLVAFVGFLVALVVAWYHGERGRQRVRWSEVVIVGLLVTVAGVALMRLRSGAPDGAGSQPGALRPIAVSDARPSVAVLPFANLSVEEENAYFASGLHDEVLTQLQHITGLRVISRASVMEYAADRPNVREIARNLGVGYVTEATVQRVGDRLRVSVQLVDAQRDDQVWAETYDGALADIFEVQSDIAEQVATALRVEMSLEERSRIQARPTDDLDAYAQYLQGRNQWNLRTEIGLNSAIQYFTRAIELDPDYASAYAGVADSYVLLPQYSAARVDARSAYAQAEAAATKAIGLDPDIAEAHASMGLVRLSFHYDWSGAEQDLRHAIDLNPGYATAHQWLSLVLSYTGRGDEAVVEAGRAQELDPLSAAVATNLGNAYRRNRDYEPAIRMYEVAIGFEPEFARAWLGLGSSFLWTERYREAAEALARWAELTGEEPADLRLLVAAASEHRRTDAPVSLPARLASGSPYLIAWRYALAGQREQSLEWLQRTYDERVSGLSELGVEPAFDILRADRRFIEILRGVGLGT